MLRRRLLFAHSCLLHPEPETRPDGSGDSTAQSRGCPWCGVHRPRLLLPDTTGPDVTEQPVKPTACVISTPQPVVGVVIHPSSSTIFTTGTGRHISVLAPGTQSSTTAQAQAEAARTAAQLALQQEAARQHDRQHELQAADMSMALEDGFGSLPQPTCHLTGEP
jgi:hypothetical protein